MPELLTKQELEDALFKFYINTTRNDGALAELDTLTFYKNSIARYLESKNSHNIKKDPDFVRSRVVLEKEEHSLPEWEREISPTLAMFLKNEEMDVLFNETDTFGVSNPEQLQGNKPNTCHVLENEEMDVLFNETDTFGVSNPEQLQGNKPNTCHVLENEEMDVLFNETDTFGVSNPEQLQRTVWWKIACHFGHRARDESQKLEWGTNQKVCNKASGRQMLVSNIERGFKTKNGAPVGYLHSFYPKALETGGSRCPVMVYNEFEKRRPRSMLTADAPFCLGYKTLEAFQ